MIAKKISVKNHKEWDTFVKSSKNGTLFHTLKFQTYHKANTFSFYNIGFYDKNKLVAVLPGSLDQSHFKSPTGASYGSFVMKDISLSSYESVIDCFLKYCIKKEIKKVTLTPPPIIYSSELHEVQEFVLTYKGFHRHKELLSNAIDLTSVGDTIIDSFSPMHRRAIKKAEKLLVKVTLSDDFDTFYEMLIENKKKFNTKPTHTLEEIRKIKQLFPEHIKLFIAYTKDGQPIASILLFLTNETTALAFYINHYYSFQEYRAVNYLQFVIVKWLKEKNFKWLDLGVSMDTKHTNPMEPSRTLVAFKEGMHSHGFLRTSFVWNSK